jgi:hypothetical protein
MTLRLVRNTDTASRNPHDGQTLVRRAISRIRETVCALSGHDAMLHFERGRISLRCVTCGHETPGWTVGPSRLRSQQPHSQSKAA